MAAYRRMDDLYSHLRTDCLTPRSAPGSTLDNEHGKPLPLPYTCWWTWLDSGHSRPSSWRRHPHRCWGVEAHLLVLWKVLCMCCRWYRQCLSWHSSAVWLCQAFRNWREFQAALVSNQEFASDQRTCAYCAVAHRCHVIFILKLFSVAVCRWYLPM